MTKKLTTLLVASLFSGASMATDLSYNNFTIGYAESTIDAGAADIDSEGVTFGLSFGVTEDIYVKLDTLQTSFSENGAFFDFDISTINVGYNMELTQEIDFIAELGFADFGASIAAPGTFEDVSDDGVNLVVGVRGMLSESFEWGANVQYFDLDESETFANIEGRYLFNDSFSLGLKATVESDVNIYSLTARFDF